MIGHRFPPLLPAESVLAGSGLVIAPHADDEVIGAGGLLAMARRAGCDLHVLHLTDGRDGDPEGRFGDIVAVRREEGRLALAELSMGPARELGLRDGTLGAGTVGLAQSIAEELARCRPANLVAPSPFEAHPDHRAAAEAVRRALAESASCAVEHVLFYGVNTPVPANALVDITPVQALKDRAMARYVSQIDYNDIRAKVRALDASRTVNVDLESVVACEAFLRLPSDRVAELFELAADLDRAVFRGL